MYTPLVFFSALSLATQATAQFSFPSPDIEYDAPPLESGVLGVTAFFTLTTLIQLIIVSTYLIRAHSSHLLPAILGVSGILFILISYVLRIVQFLAIFESFNPSLPATLVVRLDPAWRIFDDWADPLIFVAVALIARDRYRTHSQKSDSEKTVTKPLRIELLMIPFYVLSAFIVIFSSAYIGVFQTLPTVDSGLPEAQFDAQLAKYFARLKVGDRLLYTSEAMYCFATVLLIPLAILVRSRIGKDKLMNWTLFAIIPFLCLRLIPQIIILVKEAKPTLDIVGEQLDLASITTDGIFYFIVFSFFCHIFLWTRLWNGPGEQPNNSYGHMGGQMPLAQFPGQWGYPQGGAYVYVQGGAGVQHFPPQGQPQGGQGQAQQFPPPQAQEQDLGSGQVTHYPLPQTQQVSGANETSPQ